MDSIKANGSVAHTIGNVTFQITEMIKGWFPSNFFRHTHINTRLSYRESKREENNSNYEFIKKNRPMISIKPTPIFNDTDTFGAYSLLFNNIYDTSFGNFQPFFRDNKCGVGISYLLNRLKIVFEITIYLDTELQQYNIYHYLLNKLTDQQVYNFNTALEFYIPKKLVELLSVFSNIPIRNDQGTVKEFLDYFMMNANRYVTFKEQTSSASEEFYMYYPLIIQWAPSDFSLEEPAKKGFVTQSCNINFMVTAEFNMVGMYELFYEEYNKAKIANMDLSMDMSDGSVIIPYFTIGNLFEETDVHGWKLFYSNIFMCEVQPDHKPDIIDLDPIIGTNKSAVREIIEYHKKEGIPNTVVFNIIIMKNNTKLSDKPNPETGRRDYSVDYDNLKIKIYNINESATYRLVIYLNNLYINNLINTINDIDESYEQPRYIDPSGRSKDDEKIGKK